MQLLTAAAARRSRASRVAWLTGDCVSHPTVSVAGEVLVEPSLPERERSLARAGLVHAAGGRRDTMTDTAAATGPQPRAPDGPVSVLTCASCGKRNTIRPSPKGTPHCGACGKPLPWLVNATDATFNVESAASPTVLVDLWAPWCGPCRFVGPILEELSRDYAGRLKVVKVNVDDNPQLAQRFQAVSIPTLVVLKAGRVVDRIVGALPKSDLTVRLTPYLLRT